MILADAWLSYDLEPGGAKRQLLGHLSLDPSLIQPRLHYHHYYYHCHHYYYYFHYYYYNNYLIQRRQVLHQNTANLLLEKRNDGLFQL